MKIGYLCKDCPRACGVWRDEASGNGFCGCTALPSLVRAAPHFGEEPCISGTRGSGAVFFSGCNLKCVFCQNHEISRDNTGKQVSVEKLREILLRLRDKGVHNINLVTPTHYTRIIAQALQGLNLGIPVVWNSSGYETVEMLRMLEGLVQIYLPDLKYTRSDLAKRYSAAPDYFEAASAAIAEMFRQTGPFRMDQNGILLSGVMIRHLILPDNEEASMDVIDYVADTFPLGSVLFSLMCQYTPMPDSSRFPELCFSLMCQYTPMPCSSRFPELCRTVSPESNEMLCHYLKTRGIDAGYWQEPSSATDEMIPAFDGTGL